MRRWFNLLEEHKEDLAILLTAEAGKPLAESRGELSYGSSFIEWFAEEAKRINVCIIPIETIYLYCIYVALMNTAN